LGRGRRKRGNLQTNAVDIFLLKQFEDDGNISAGNYYGDFIYANTSVSFLQDVPCVA
jgi:hypothetical protein